MTDSLLPLTTLGATIKAHIAAGDKAFGKAEEHYKSAGLHLIEARDRVKREGMTFSAFIVSQCGLGRSRAYELIAIADGTKTLEEVRSGANDRKVKHRTNTDRPFRNGQPEDDTDDGSMVAAPEVVIDNLLHSIGGMNESARVFNKVLKASTFDQGAVTKINAAINRMIKRWGSIQSVLGVTTPALSGADVERLNEKLDAGLRLIGCYSDNAADTDELKEQLAAAQAEVDRLTQENDRLRADEGSEPDWITVSDSERSADEIIRTEFAIEFRQVMVFEGYGDEPEAQQGKRRLASVDFQAAGGLLGQLAAKHVIKKIRERKKLEASSPPDKAALAALRKRAQALGYKTIHRRGDDYYLIDDHGDRCAGGNGLNGIAATLDYMEAFEAGAVQVFTTACGKPVSAHDINGEVALDDPRAVEAFAHLAAEASSALAA